MNERKACWVSAMANASGEPSDSRRPRPLLRRPGRSGRGSLSAQSALLPPGAHPQRALIRERQREGIELAKRRGAYRGRRLALTDDQIASLRARAAAGTPKAALDREFAISRQTVYQYLRAPHPAGAAHPRREHGPP